MAEFIRGGLQGIPRGQVELACWTCRASPRSVLANPAWPGWNAELYLFCALVYFIFSFSLSKAASRWSAGWA